MLRHLLHEVLPMKLRTLLTLLFALLALSLATTALAADAPPGRPVILAEQVSAGGERTCVVTDGGGVMCWGDSSLGALGRPYDTPNVPGYYTDGLATGAGAVTAGGRHTCALTTAGGVKCWGHNGDGQLGDGTRTDRSAPVDVFGLMAGVSAVDAGEHHTCAVTAGGAVKCWGYNGYGALGNGGDDSESRPVDVTGLSSGMAAVSAGGFHTCALTAEGGVKCWGNNGSGQLGDGTRENRKTPVDVVGLSSGVAAVSTGRHRTCALLKNGGVKCWGWMEHPNMVTVPQDVTGWASGMTDLNVGDMHVCAVNANGGVECWGYNNYGQLGDGTAQDRYTPAVVPGAETGIVAVAAGLQHTCALTARGLLRCWGDNGSNQLGNGNGTWPRTPVAVTGLPEQITSLAAGREHTCATTAEGDARCWGANRDRQLGVLSPKTYRPVTPAGLAAPAEKVVSGAVHTCALLADGSVSCWGKNEHGQLGDGSFSTPSLPVPVKAMPGDVADIAAGVYRSCAVTAAGAAFCWGSNDGGALGDGTTTNRPAPTPVNGLGSGVKAIAAGLEHTCAITDAGAALCWGGNSRGQLGDNSGQNQLTPAPVQGLSQGVVALALGDFHTCALTDAGGVKCWGLGYDGQLGYGQNIEDKRTPTDVLGLQSGVAEITAGPRHTCARLESGQVKCWGVHGLGANGSPGAPFRTLTPLAVAGFAEGVTTISAGSNHTCAALPQGGARCWGSNAEAQLGIDPGWTPRTALRLGMRSWSHLPWISR
jgi:alpha-tubulin suppressor-like RCC1 family protein